VDFYFAFEIKKGGEIGLSSVSQTPFPLLFYFLKEEKMGLQ
jgi:hypothetical protein